MSTWQSEQVETAVLAALAAVPMVRDKRGDDHHFGRPYLSAYQLALMLREREPDLVDRVGKPMGGADSGEEHTLPGYLALQISGWIKRAGAACPIEGAFLARRDVVEISFRDGTTPLVATFQDAYSLSLFRLREE
jgi:hypothetical protein